MSKKRIYDTPLPSYFYDPGSIDTMEETERFKRGLPEESWEIRRDILDLLGPTPDTILAKEQRRERQKKK